MTDLLPCPFCGSDDIDFEHNGEARCWMYCKTCLCDGPIAEMPKNDTKAKINATEAWNKRAASLPWQPIETLKAGARVLLLIGDRCYMGAKGVKSGSWYIDSFPLLGDPSPTHWLDVMP